MTRAAITEESPVYRAVVEKTYKGVTYKLYYGPYGTRAAAAGTATREANDQIWSAARNQMEVTVKSWTERLVGYWKQEEVTA